MHMHQLATGVITVLEQLLDDLTTELPNNPQISRASLTPYIRLLKRRTFGKKDGPKMRIGEGVTIVPLEPTEAPGTNEREDTGYRFIIAIAQGTLGDEIDGDWPIGIWEQNIRQRFQHQRLNVSLDSACDLGCLVKSGGLPEFAELEDGIDASFLEMTCFVREARRV
jgi:hypothetical protein